MDPAWISGDKSLSLYKGDCRDVLAAMPEASFTACLTDPKRAAERQGSLPL